jgi:hypothetical protein
MHNYLVGSPKMSLDFFECSRQSDTCSDLVLVSSEISAKGINPYCDSVISLFFSIFCSLLDCGEVGLFKEAISSPPLGVVATRQGVRRCLRGCCVL